MTCTWACWLFILPVKSLLLKFCVELSSSIIAFFSSINYSWVLFLGSLCLCWTTQLTLLSYTALLILLGCSSVFSYNSLSFFHWLFWILCQAVCRSPFLQGQLVLYHVPFVASCRPDHLSLMSLLRCCTFEKIITPSSLYRLALSEKGLL